MKHNQYLPENVICQHWAVYTGAHDNPTTPCWWLTLDQNSRNRISVRINGEVNLPLWHLFDMSFATTGRLVIVPLRDLLHLDNE